MEKDVKEMKKDSSLEGQENLETVDTDLDGIGDMSGNDEWEINIDQLLEQADMLVNNDMMPPMPELEGENNNWAISNDAAAPARQETAGKPEAAPEPNTEIDSDLDEINSLLEQANLNEKIDEDMLALLESATENQADDDNPDEVFDIFSEEDMPLGDMKSSGTPEQTEAEGEEAEEGNKKKKGGKKKKNKKKKNASAKDGESENKDKKPGFLAKITALFGGEEDFDEEPDTASEENVKILNELNGDEGGKSPKKANKKKDKDKGKKKAKEAKPKAKAKEKKPAAAKKKKEKPIEKTTEKPVKILNGKSFAAIAGLCFSIIAGVMIVTTFIPEYADKQSARKAFRDGDYETVYKLFYDKKLSADEELLFYQSRVIRQMERRLEAYQNNITLGRELEAVDALMRGVETYQSLWEADEYQVRNEVDALYGQICGILESNYGVSREEAVAIASYDKIEYTKALYTILGNGEIGFGNEEADAAREVVQDGADAGADALPSEDRDPEEDILPDDLLPAEEDIID